MLPAANVPTPPEVTWYNLIISIVQSAIQVVETLRRAQVIYDANGLATLISATQPGYAVGAAPMTKEQAEAYAHLIDSFQVYLNQPVAADQPTPLQILYRTWPAPTPPAR